MTNQERIRTIQRFGFTDREASFLCLVALNGGYFLRRQYDFFLGQKTTGTGNRLLDKGLARRVLKPMPTTGVQLVYRLCFRPFFEAIDEGDNRNRRWRSPGAVRAKLMGLDYVLGYPQHQYLATETEKVAHFTAAGIATEWFPGRVYSSKDGRRNTSRYFVDKFPIYLSGAPDAPSPVVHFCYVDTAIGKPTGFDTYLLQYRHLLGRLPSFGVTYVSCDELAFAKAEQIFARLIGGAMSSETPVIDPDLVRLVEHFRARQLWDRRQLQGFDKQQLDQLRDELQEFKAARYQALYAVWKERGDAAVVGDPPQLRHDNGTFSTHLLPFEYPLFPEEMAQVVA